MNGWHSKASATLALSVSPSAKDQAYTCWLRGDGLGQAQISIQRVCGADISTEVIRLYFAEFAQGLQA